MQIPLQITLFNETIEKRLKKFYKNRETTCKYGTFGDILGLLGAGANRAYGIRRWRTLPTEGAAWYFTQ